MSSYLCELDGSSSFYCHSSPEMVSSGKNNAADHFFPDPFSVFCNSPVDILQELTSNQNQQNPVDESYSFDQFVSTILSSSPPSHQLENLSLYQSTQLQSQENSSSLENGYEKLVGLSGLEVKNEECQFGLDFACNQTFSPHSYSGAENVMKYMQRSLSSKSCDAKPGFLFQPQFDTLMESPNFHNQTFSSPENSFFSGQMRRVCSTGDLQNTRKNRNNQRSFSRPLATESSFMEEANFKVGRYSAEERKERISKYRAKRTQRNFSKTIKYACRKTLADSRPRIRGRFARNDETGEIQKPTCSARDEGEDELWVDGLQEEEDEGTMRGGGGGAFVNGYGQSQLQYYGCF